MINEYKKVIAYGNHLLGKKLAFIVTGSTIAYKAFDVILELRKYGCDVFAYATTNGLKYVTEEALKSISGNNIINDTLDVDAIIICPATNSFIKTVSDKTMNDTVVSNLIHNNQTNTKTIYFTESLGENNNVSDDIIKLTNYSNAEIISSEGMDSNTTASRIVRILSASNLRDLKVLVTAGPTPVKVDNVRRITNKFSGKLGIEIANELYLRGADVMLFQSYSGIRPPKYINQILFEDYEEYKQLCISHCLEYQYGIFSAAVADYKPKTVVSGKIPSGGLLTNIELIQTEKVINLIRSKNHDLKMISFKYEEGKTFNELIAIANKRLQIGHVRVVANDLSLNTDKQKCFLCGLDEDNKTTVISQAEGKINIARMVADDLEKLNV